MAHVTPRPNLRVVRPVEDFERPLAEDPDYGGKSLAQETDDAMTCLVIGIGAVLLASLSLIGIAWYHLGGQ